jgi:Domain of unknown function (DUF5668)
MFNIKDKQMRHRSLIGAYVLITVGTYFLLLKQGWVPNIGYLLAEWWPLILIIVGVGMIVRQRSRRWPKG